MKKKRRILGDVVKPTKGEERASPEDDDEDAEDQLHRKSEEMWRSHRRRRDVSTGVDHKMGKDVPALKIDGGDARTMRCQRSRNTTARRVTRYEEESYEIRRGPTGRVFCETIGIVSK